MVIQDTKGHLYQDSGERVLVTGATGFIGSHLCRRLCEAGAEVHAISRGPISQIQSDLRWWCGDLADADKVKYLLSEIKPDVIFHLAGYPIGAREVHHVIPSLRSNLISTVNLLTASSERGCRKILLAGSLEEPAEGDHLVTPSSPYAVAKWASSAYARMFFTLYKLPVVLLRIFMVYGPEQQDVKKIIPYVILSLLRGESPKLTSGLRLVDWVYVDDVVDGLLAAAAASEVEGKTVDLGSGQLVSIRRVVESLVNMVNPNINPSFGAVADRPLEQVRAADAARSASLIGWRASTTLEQGLRHTTNWYRGQIPSKSNAIIA